MAVKTEKKDGKIFTSTPYNALFVKKAKMLDGIWQAPHWVFDEKVEEQVKELLVEVYGTDGGPTMLQSVNIYLDEFPYDGKIVWAENIILAQRRFRDKPPVMYPGCLVVEGGFKDSGGSVKNPRLEAEEGTVLRVGLPYTIVEKIKHLKGVEVFRKTSDEFEKEIEAIEAEIERLLGRKEEILEIFSK